MRNTFALIFSVGSLLVGVALLLSGVGLLNTLLPLRGGLEGYSTQFLGVILSGYFAGFLLGTFLGPKLIRRIGHIRAFACCAAIVTCCALSHVLIVNPYAWLLLRLITGSALVTLYTVIESWLNGQASQTNRGQMLALYMMVNLLSLAVSQQFIQLSTPTEFVLFALAAALICSALIPVTVTRLTPPPIPSAPSLSFSVIVNVAPIAVIGAVLSGLSMGAFWTLTPVFVNTLFNDYGVVATFMSVAILGGALMQLPIGHISDKHDRRWVLAWVSALASASAILIFISVPLFAELKGLFYIAGFLYGGCAFAIYPLAVAHLIDHLQREQVLDGSSAFLLLHGVGAVMGPILAGALMDHVGALVLVPYFGVMNIVLSLAVVTTMRFLPSSRLEPVQTAHYIPLVRTTPTVLELHPDKINAPEQPNLNQHRASGTNE